jgi:hypothetical protein
MFNNHMMEIDMSIKPKKGSSYFLRYADTKQSLFSFVICLSSKSDEDGEYKVLRSDFYPTIKDALSAPLNEVCMFDFEEQDLIKVLEWSSSLVKSLSLSRMGMAQYRTQARLEVDDEEREEPNLDLDSLI